VLVEEHMQTSFTIYAYIFPWVVGLSVALVK